MKLTRKVPVEHIYILELTELEAYALAALTGATSTVDRDRIISKSMIRPDADGKALDSLYSILDTALTKIS